MIAIAYPTLVHWTPATSTRLIISSSRCFGQWQLSLSIEDIRYRPLWWCVISLPPAAVMICDISFSSLTGSTLSSNAHCPCFCPSPLSLHPPHCAKGSIKHLLHCELLRKDQNTVYFAWHWEYSEREKNNEPRGCRPPPPMPLPLTNLPMLFCVMIIGLLLGRRLVQIAAQNSKTVCSTCNWEFDKTLFVYTLGAYRDKGRQGETNGDKREHEHITMTMRFRI